MKTNRLSMIIAAVGVLSLIFVAAFTSSILGDQKVPNPTTEELVSKIQSLQEEIDKLKDRIAELEIKQRVSPGHPQDLYTIEPSPNVVPDGNQLPKGFPKGSSRREFNGMTYYIIPLQDQSSGQ